MGTLSCTPIGCLDCACRLYPPRMGLTGGETKP
jgi:hypothetical protein